MAGDAIDLFKVSRAESSRTRWRPIYRHGVHRDHTRSRRRLAQSRHLSRHGPRRKIRGAFHVLGRQAWTHAHGEVFQSRETLSRSSYASARIPCCFSRQAIQSSSVIPSTTTAAASEARPYDLVKGEVTGLPFPAHAEIAIEGFLHPGDIKPDGPFGEWLGYYGTRMEDTPVLRIERVYYRNDPILCVARPGRPPTDYSLSKGMIRAAQAVGSRRESRTAQRQRRVVARIRHRQSVQRDLDQASLSRPFAPGSVPRIAVSRRRLQRTIRRRGRRRHRSDERVRRVVGDGDKVRS